MEILTGTADFHLSEETAVAIGKFDGVHIGHRRLLEEIIKQKEQGRKACVFTFDPPPSVFFGNPREKLLSTKEEKRELFAKLGTDILVEFPLREDTAAIEPERFVKELLYKGLHAGFVAAGSDLSFGAGGRGNAALLRAMAADCGMEVRIIEKVLWEGREISSSLVREAVEKGDMIKAETLLGMPYTISGSVRHGNRIGHSLGMPTLNLRPSADKLLPPNGVYFSGVRLKGKRYAAISNIGIRPTVEETEKYPGVESYLYGYEGEAYGEEIQVELYAFRRSERKFTDLDALKRQLWEDMEAGASFTR